MAFTQNELDYIVNPALDRIGAGNVSFSNQSGREYTIADRYYTKTRDMLLRSYEWSFAAARTTLYPIQTIVLDSAPLPSVWSVGDTITGITSGQSAEVLEVVDDVTYVVSGTATDFTAGEAITSATVYSLAYNGAPMYRYNDTTGANDDMVWYDESASNQVKCASGYPTSTDTTPGYEWTYQYDLPEDFIRLINVHEDDGTDGAEYRYTIEGNRILTNYTTMNIKYVKQFTDPTAFTELFREVLILRLAMKFINPLASTQSQAFKDELRTDLQYAEMQARVVDAQENNTTGRADWLLARYAQQSTAGN